jgi:hypothetical protein
VVGIPASQFEFSEKLSAFAQKGVDDCTELVDKILSEDVS